MMQHNKLEILHLTKRFGEKTLFEDLNLTVEEPAVLWAPSGWGKTTLLRVLMGLETSTSGSVQGVGQVSAVFQEDRLCPQLNAVQNVALVLPGLETQYKEQIGTCFQQLGLDSTALVLPARKLSGGQKRRVALLRALLAPSEMLSFIDSMTAPMSLINALLVGIATKMGTDVTKTFTTLERLWDQYDVFGGADDE